MILVASRFADGQVEAGVLLCVGVFVTRAAVVVIVTYDCDAHLAVNTSKILLVSVRWWSW